MLFGSFARGDFSARSDIDLFVVLRCSGAPTRERIAEFLKDCAEYPTDVFPLTEDELQTHLSESDPFWTQAVREGIECYSGGPKHTLSDLPSDSMTERQSRITVRRYASAAEADRHDVEFWMQMSPAERVLQAWRLSQEQWRLARLPDESGLCRSVASVHRR